MVAMGAKELFQIIIGARQISTLIAMKQARPVAACDFANVGEHSDKGWSAMALGTRHCPEQGAEAPFNAMTIAFFGIGQNGGSPLHPVISCPHQGPEQSGTVEALVDEALEPEEGFG
jgi:hypothetical protein